MKITFKDIKTNQPLTQEEVEERGALLAKDKTKHNPNTDYDWESEVIVYEGHLALRWEQSYYETYDGGIYQLSDVDVVAIFSEE